MDRLKIFISSTMTDLQAERQAVEQAIAELRLEAVRAETLGSQPMPSRQASLEMARQCDIYLGIYGARYGWVPPGDQVSVTEMELQEAREQGKDILVYVKDVPEREEAQVDFVRQVEDFDEGFFRRPYFTTPEQLAEWVKEDIAALVSRRYREGEETVEAERKIVVEQEAGTVEAGGELLGGEIGEMPGGEVEVKQKVDTVKGKSIGLKIDKLG
jgi:hypothetical protein